MRSTTKLPENLDRANTLISEAKRNQATVVALPEFFPLIGAPSASVEISEAAGDGPIQQFLSQQAKQHHIWLLGGTIPLKSDIPKKLKAASLLYSPEGNCHTRYDKIHLFDANVIDNTGQYRESVHVQPGETVMVARTPLGRLGLSVCYDIRFPGLYRDLAKAGAEIIMVPSAFTKTTGEAHWHVLNRARAIENGAFVVAPCAVGPIDGGGECFGHSLIVDPWGKVLADGGDKRGVIQNTIDLDQVSIVRNKIPSLNHDQPFTVEN